jgi:hypothetical protein
VGVVPEDRARSTVSRWATSADATRILAHQHALEVDRDQPTEAVR